MNRTFLFLAMTALAVLTAYGAAAAIAHPGYETGTDEYYCSDESYVGMHHGWMHGQYWEDTTEYCHDDYDEHHNWMHESFWEEDLGYCH